MLKKRRDVVKILHLHRIHLYILDHHRIHLLDVVDLYRIDIVERIDILDLNRRDIVKIGDLNRRDVAHLLQVPPSLVCLLYTRGMSYTVYLVYRRLSRIHPSDL